MDSDAHADSPVLRDHRRQWRRCLYVYPVISRRARGLSIGVNLNPDKRCTFGCVYCQIDRTVPRGLAAVDVDILRRELDEAMEAACGGAIWSEPRFAPTPPALRRLNDIAFSGDGEPTCLPQFDEAVAAAAEVRRTFRRDNLKLVVITNATQLASPQFRRALPILDANNGEVWAKLDAGTEEYFRRVNRPQGDVTLERIVADIAELARGRAVVIQTLLCRLDGRATPPEELAAYVGRLRRIVAAGGRIGQVQLHTVARPPAEGCVSALSDGELAAAGATVRAALPELRVDTFSSAEADPPRAR